MDLTINVCTRGRPEVLLHSLRETAARIEDDATTLLVSIDDDDQPTIDAMSQFPARATPDIRPREDSLGDKMNRALTAAPADFYMHMSNYAWVTTPGFDRKITEAGARFPDGIGIVCGHMHNASFPGCQAVSAKLAEKMGFIHPPYFPFWFTDHWIDDIARIIGRYSFADVRVTTGLRPDGGTQSMRELMFWVNFFDAGILARRDCAHAIIKGDDFLEPEWRKEMLFTHHPMIEYRSRWQNNILRGPEFQGYAAARDAGASDARYMRLRKQAADLYYEWSQELIRRLQ